MAKKKPVSKATLANIVIEPKPITEETLQEEETSPVKETILAETQPSESVLSSNFNPQRPKISPYTSPRVTLHIGPQNVVFYVPKGLLRFPQWVMTNRWGEITLSDMDAGTGHTLVHYLHTGSYQTLNNRACLATDEARIEFGKALLTYNMAITYDLLDLQILAIREMEEQGAKMDIFEVVEAIKEHFPTSSQTTWLHGYLQKKTRVAFEEDHTVFRRNTSLESLQNLHLSKIVLIYVLKLYEEKMSEMFAKEKNVTPTSKDHVQAIGNSTLEESIPKQNVAILQGDSIPMADETITKDYYDQETFDQRTISSEEFRTISCPSSNESDEYVEDPVDRISKQTIRGYQCIEEDHKILKRTGGPIQGLVKSTITTEQIKALSDGWEETTEWFFITPKPVVSDDGICIPLKNVDNSEQ